MAQDITLVDPAACRRRAEQCRERAERAPTVREDLLHAAYTWDELARHAEHLQAAYGRLQASGQR